LQRQPEGIRVGVLGVGYWGSRHVRVLRSTTGVGTVVGVDQRYTGGTASQVADGDVVEYADLGAALPAVDAVVIATPPSSHYELGMQAIEAGKHVLIEKPLAASPAEARALVDAAQAAGTLLMPGHTFLYNAAVHKLRDLVQGGELGKLYYLDCERLNLGLYQSDVNVILDLAPHDISIANFVLNSRPTTITAWGSRHVHAEHEDVAHLRLDYSDAGVLADIHVSWLYPHKVRRVTAVGSRKMAVYDDMAADERIRVYDKFAMSPQEGSGPLSRVAYHFGDVVSPFVDFAEPLAVQDQHFVDCVVNDCRPSIDGENGLAVVEALECAQISLREQRPVALAEVTQFAAGPANGAAVPALHDPASAEAGALAAVHTAERGGEGNGQRPVH
jgi:predicted dehydrogenase